MAMPDDQRESPSEPSPYEGLTSYDSFLSSSRKGEVVHIYECGGCGIVSEHFRIYLLLTVVLLPFIIIIWRVDAMIKCPRCMRRHIMSRLPIIMLASNLASPIIVIWWLVVFFRTFNNR